MWCGSLCSIAAEYIRKTVWKGICGIKLRHVYTYMHTHIYAQTIFSIDSKQLFLDGKHTNLEMPTFFKASSLLNWARVLRIEKILHAHAYIAHCVNISMGKIKTFYSMKATSNTLIERHNVSSMGKKFTLALVFLGSSKIYLKNSFKASEWPQSFVHTIASITPKKLSWRCHQIFLFKPKNGFLGTLYSCFTEKSAVNRHYNTKFALYEFVSLYSKYAVEPTKQHTLLNWIIQTAVGFLANFLVNWNWCVCS